MIHDVLYVGSAMVAGSAFPLGAIWFFMETLPRLTAKVRRRSVRSRHDRTNTRADA
jgi:hypothetical protein